jgi:hypothetical protein
VQIYGGYDKNRNRAICEQSEMGRRIEVGTLTVPDDKPLAGQDEPTPHVLSGDEPCPLKHNLKWPSPT